MNALKVAEVTGRRDLGVFLRFPERVYASDPFWVPPLQAWQRQRLSPKNPFFADASMKLWIAWRNGEPVGTVSLLRDRRHEELRGEAVAFFGFFETIDDPLVADALLGTAREAAVAGGAKLLRGPRNLSRVEETGLLIEGHSSAPPLLAGHHPAWYRPLLEGLGFAPHHDVLAYDALLMDAGGKPRSLPEALGRRASSLSIPGLEIRPVRSHGSKEDLALAHEVFVEAFRSVPENTPMPRDQFVSLGRAILWFTDRRLLQLATVNGRAAGFAICFPELNEAVRHANGRLLPLGWWRLLRAIRRIRTASFKLIGVMPEFRGSGLHALLIRHAVQAVQEAGFKRLEASLIDERNHPMRRVVESAGLSVYRRYRIYEQEI
jgi:GNAT superfamily N-acetyltransferase